MNVKGKKTERCFQGQALVALVELGRLLCCNGRKMRAFMHRYRSAVLESEAKEGDEPIPFADARTYTNELKRHEIDKNIKTKWEAGTFGVHAIKINWWCSADKEREKEAKEREKEVDAYGAYAVTSSRWRSVDEERKKDCLVGRPRSARKSATLLAIANRSSDTNANRLDEREREIFFAVLPEYVSEDIIAATLETFVRMNREMGEEEKQGSKPVHRLCIVTNSARIMALHRKAVLESWLTPLGVEVCIDEATCPPSCGKTFEITLALPTVEALENYIAMVMKFRKLPTRRNKWKGVRRICHDREEVRRRLGKFWPILVRP